MLYLYILFLVYLNTLFAKSNVYYNRNLLYMNGYLQLDPSRHRIPSFCKYNSSHQNVVSKSHILPLNYYMSSWFENDKAEDKKEQVATIDKHDNYIRYRKFRIAWARCRGRSVSRLISDPNDIFLNAPFEPEDFEKYLDIRTPKQVAEFYADREPIPEYKFGSGVKEPEIQPYDSKKCELKAWPKNTFLRIKLHSHFRIHLKLAIMRIKEAVEKSGCLEVARVGSIPRKIRRFMVVCSPTIDKRSKDHYEIEHHTRIIDIYPKSKITNYNMVFKKLLLIPMPVQVNYESWFQERNKPLKASVIHSQHEKKWVSRYYLYHRDKGEKERIVNEILQEDNKKYMLMSWPKDFYSLYKLTLHELKSMLKKINEKKHLEKQYEIFDIQKPNIRHFEGGDEEELLQLALLNARVHDDGEEKS